MNTPLSRKPLAVTVADHLRAGIRKGRWIEQLPGETGLARDLGVSRSTLRSALRILRREGLLETRQGRASTIRHRAVESPAARRHDTVALLAPFPLEKMRYYVVHWIDELRAILHDSGIGLKVHAGKAFYRQRTREVLAELVESQPADCWVLAFSNREIQAWFEETGIPTLVTGYSEEGIALPSLAFDADATVFHAVGRLTARGHRQIALVTEQISSPGLRVIMDSFKRNCMRGGTQRVEGQVISLRDGHSDTAARAMVRALQRPNGPTALVIVNPFHCHTAMTALPRNGFRIPEDVSIITTFGDRALEFLYPEPAYYQVPVHRFARKAYGLIEQICEGIVPPCGTTTIIPDAVEGQSVGFSPERAEAEKDRVA